MISVFKPPERESACAGKEPDPLTYETQAAREVDELLRTMCAFTDDGVNACKECPYRREFFGFEVN